MTRTHPRPALAAAALATYLVATAGCGGDPSDGALGKDALVSAALQAGAPGAGAPGVAALEATCDPNAPAVGAHWSHAGTAARSAIGCLECHDPCAPAPRASVVFGQLARSDGATPAWSAETRTCSGVYCHGATGVTPTGPMTWTFLDPNRPRPPQEACATCHGYPPPAPHAQTTSCATCHSAVMNADGTVDLAGGRHVDGRIDVSCDGCHSFPPASGAHVAHAGPPVSGSTPLDWDTLQDRHPDASPTEAPAAYGFGCGNCHALEAELHHDGKVDIVLGAAGAPAGSLRSRAAPGAAYDAASGTCFGTYCHSSGQEFPAYAVTPAWTSGVNPGCAGCHSNPPAYASGGAGAPDANSHLGLADDGYEYGHFLGMPGVWHTTKHGAPGAAPITCQACHYETVDPANTAPGGFYYLDTTGTYQLPGGDPGRISWGWTEQLHCTSCHGGSPGEPPQGTGRVLPLRHVNGSRDVVFDPRTALPAVAGLPPAPDTPVRPYWVAAAADGVPWPATAAWNGTTISFDLAGVTYDPSTKTCSSAACHLLDVPVWGKPYGWGPGGQNCNLCHPM